MLLVCRFRNSRILESDLGKNWTWRQITYWILNRSSQIRRMKKKFSSNLKPNCNAMILKEEVESSSDSCFFFESGSNILTFLHLLTGSTFFWSSGHFYYHQKSAMIVLEESICFSGSVVGNVTWCRQFFIGQAGKHLG